MFFAAFFGKTNNNDDIDHINFAANQYQEC